MKHLVDGCLCPLSPPSSSVGLQRFHLIVSPDDNHKVGCFTHEERTSKDGGVNSSYYLFISSFHAVILDFFV